MSKKSLKLVGKIIISLLFLFWIIFKVDWDKVLYYFRQMDIWWMFAFLIVYSIGVLISTYKWQFLASFKNIHVSFFEVFKIYLTGYFINNFFPSIIGGDTYRSYKLGKISEGKYIESTSTVLADRITGLFGVMILIFIFSLFNFDLLLKNNFLLVVDLIIIISFIAYFSLWFFIKTPIWIFIEKRMPQKLSHFILEMSSFNNPRILGKSLFWGTIFNFFGVGLATWMLFLDLHIPISFANFMVAISAVSIISSIPISIGNIGIKEWAFITFFGIYGVNGEAAISIAIFARFLQMVVSFFAIPFYLKDKNEKIIK